MIHLKVKGEVSEIVYQGEKSCLFTIRAGTRELVCTITNSRRYLTELIEEGSRVIVAGSIRAWRQRLDDMERIKNVFYVDDIEVLHELGSLREEGAEWKYHSNRFF